VSRVYLGYLKIFYVSRQGGAFRHIRLKDAKKRRKTLFSHRDHRGHRENEKKGIPQRRRDAEKEKQKKKIKRKKGKTEPSIF
jgi:hypothetical protein